MEDAGKITLVVRAHLLVPRLVARSEDMHERRPHREADEHHEMVKEHGRTRALEPSTECRDSNRHRDAHGVVLRDAPAEPPLTMPPDLALPEPTLVGRVQDEPVVIPHRAPRGDQGEHGVDLLRDRPLGPVHERVVEDHGDKDRHEQVVAREGHPVHAFPVQPGNPPLNPVPRRGLFRPPVLALRLDLHAGEDRGEDREERSTDPEHRKLRSVG